jgi:hypothetical protein
MGWIITKDHLEKMGWKDYKSQVGTESAADYKGGEMEVRVYDDDHVLYYTAKCDSETSAENFHNWAMYDSGCTMSEIRNNDKAEWEPFIS